MIFSYKNTKVCIEYSLLIIIGFAVAIGNRNILFVLLFSSLHEIGHLLMLFLFGGKLNSITFSFYGIGIKTDYKFNFVKEILFLSSGIFVNLIFFIVDFYKEINFCLFVINALPIYPLDGGRVLKLVLNKQFDLQISDIIYYFVSAVFIVFLITYSIFCRNVNLLIIILYLIIYSMNNSFE